MSSSPHTHAQSRKSSTSSSRSNNNNNVPTTFFLTSQGDLDKHVGVANHSRATTEANGPVSQAILAVKEGGRPPQEAEQPKGAEGVQKLQEALDAAFGIQKSKSTGAERNTVLSLSRQSSGKSHHSLHSSSPGSPRKRRRKYVAEEDRDDVEKVELSNTSVTAPTHETHTTNSSPDHSHAKRASASARPLQRLSTYTTSTPLTPANLDSPLSRYTDSALPGTPKSLSLHSLRLSDNGSGEHEHDQDVHSQAIESSDDDGEPDLGRKRTDAPPELVIPSIAMPARRPFTDRGKALGRLKIMVAGASGVGKSGLVRAIIRGCEDIVHVDPVPVRIPSSHSLRRKSAASCVEELFASSRPYPNWWNDVEGSRVLRRRKSMGLGDTVLDRNVCFVDTKNSQSTSTNAAIIEYLKRLASKYCGQKTNDLSETVTMLSGGGAPLVDVVLFVFEHSEACEDDLAHFRALSEFTNVIPIIGKADLLSKDEITRVKYTLLEQLAVRGLYPFLFGRSAYELAQEYRRVETGDASQSEIQTSASDASAKVPCLSTALPDSTASVRGSSKLVATHTGVHLDMPFAVSSAPGPDLETMDASLLMSPEYCPPPLPSDLNSLIAALFEPEHAAWLRHSAARKFVEWHRADSMARPQYGLRGPGDDRAALAQARCGPDGDGGHGMSRSKRSDSAHLRALQKSARHWSDAYAANTIPHGSGDSSQSLGGAQSMDVLDAATRIGGVLLGVMKVVGGMSAIGILAAVAAKAVFGVQGVEVVALGEGWKWTVVMGDGRS